MNTILRWSCLSLAVVACTAEDAGPSRFVDPFVGVKGPGSCMPGPCLPHASVYPSPDTITKGPDKKELRGQPSGHCFGQPVVGFSQLHTQGTGGTPTYGLLLVSPRLGPGTSEEEHASPIDEVQAACHSFRARLVKWDTRCTVVPAAHSALYRFTFPANDDARIVLDVARKIAKATALTEGSVRFDPATGTITGGGTYDGNWNPAPYQLFFAAQIDAKPTATGTWQGATPNEGGTEAHIAKRDRLGLWLRFDARQTRTVHLKIAVSFTSVEKAAAYLKSEIPAWDCDGLQATAQRTWDQALSAIQAPGLPADEARLFYSHFFHALVQPRDRTGDLPGWPADAPAWDDHYTMWDTWKTVFPLLALVQPEVVAGNVQSLVMRQKLNGKMSAAFIQGKEYYVGQGGDEADNIIGDACAKKIPGIDWNQVWEALAAQTAVRTPHYIAKGWVAHKEKTDRCWRLKSGSGTIAFAYNDWCAAQVAETVGKADEAKRLRERSRNWRNVWDPACEDGGFTGFIRARNADSTFCPTPANKGYNTDFYEGTCWIYSYVIPHDVPGMVEAMGGKQRFIERLVYAFHHDLIEFGNEPSFMTPWLACHVDRPYLASFCADRMRRSFGPDGSPGDDDSGAMGSLFVFLNAGFFPFCGTDAYYLHGARVPRLDFRIAGGKTFTVTAANAGGRNIYVQSATLGGKPLDRAMIRHADILAGGTLAFVMGDQPSGWGCQGEFDAARAAKELAK